MTKMKKLFSLSLVLTAVILAPLFIQQPVWAAGVTGITNGSGTPPPSSTSPGGTTQATSPSPTPSVPQCSGYSSAKCSACEAINELGSSQNCASGGSNVTSLLSVVVNILSYVVGAIAVIMIIISAIRFAASGGNATSVESAKKTLIYAIIGLAVAALAQVIIHLTLTTASKVGMIITDNHWFI